MVMPPLLLQQYRIFRASPSAVAGQPTMSPAGQGETAQATGGNGATSNMTGQPLGVALWAYLSPETEEKLKFGGHRLRPDEWAVGLRIEGGGREAGGSSSSPTDGSSPLDDQEGGGREHPDHSGEGSSSSEVGAQAAGGGNASKESGSSPLHITKQEGGSLWLVDLICPFHTPDNKLADNMLADLIQGPFKGKKFKFHHTDPQTGARKVVELGG